MRRGRALGALVAVAVVGHAGTAHAGLDFWTTRGRVDVLIDQAAAARERSELSLAAALLDEAERASEVPRARVQRERAFLELARGRLEDAARLFGAAADLQPELGVRRDQAAVLVQLGRWPDAIAALRRAFAEQGSALRVEEIRADPRFAGLAGFEPFEKLVDEISAEQAGPLGRFLLRLERIEAAAEATADVAKRLAAVMVVVWRLVGASGAAVLALVLMGLVLAGGFNQLGILAPPGPLFLGMSAASVLWHLGVRIGSGGVATGLSTITWALAVVFGPYLLLYLAATLWRFVRQRRRVAGDPFTDARLPDTLLLMERVVLLGRRYLNAAADDRQAVRQELDAARLRLLAKLHSSSGGGADGGGG
ncbi:MAG: hypothetical protein HY903_07360 [Deltaproteobacteria bacterium]|nr:hypothetical protein [Deltaproteobacteria bacterium]